AGDAGAEQLPRTHRRSGRKAVGRRRTLPGTPDPPDGAANRRASRLHVASRTGPALLHPLGHGPGAQADLPATAVDSWRARATVAGITGGGTPGTRAYAPGKLRGLPAPAHRDHLFRSELPHASDPGVGVPP